MTHAHAEQLERSLLAERSRLQRELERLTTPPTDAAGGHGRFGDDTVESSAALPRLSVLLAPNTLTVIAIIGYTHGVSEVARPAPKISTSA